ncbi:IS110 family transposase, partial [Caballeronia arationis]|uniref:IS110 family transposase n=1 Tax=Caballeronia arationis TaxID=1777142 RepID=UPI001F47221F
WVGIDWADTKHDICVQAAGESRRESARYLFAIGRRSMRRLAWTLSEALFATLQNNAVCSSVCAAHTSSGTP